MIMTRFTYFEPLIDGHCTFWARMALSRLPQDPRVSEVRLLTSPTMLERVKDVVTAMNITCDLIPPEELEQMTTGSLWRRGQAQWSMAKRLSKDGVAFLPFFDHAVVAAATDPFPVQKGGRVSGIIFRPPNTYNLPRSFKTNSNAMRRWSTYALARRVTGGPLFTLDELAPLGKGGRLTKALTYLPDPAPDLDLLNTVNPIWREDKRQVVLLFGALTRRKGIFEALQAWRYLSLQDRARFVLRFVGRLGNEERAPFMSALKNAKELLPNAIIELEDGFITDENLAREIAGSDIILAPYQNHIGSSGVMHWAVAANKPLIAQDTGLIGYQVSKYGLGSAINCQEPELIATTLSTVETQSKKPHADFAERHMSDAFVRNILNETLV
jgi:glycosyltransferase involved in cell wall biosynthesis